MWVSVWEAWCCWSAVNIEKLPVERVRSERLLCCSQHFKFVLSDRAVGGWPVGGGWNCTRLAMSNFLEVRKFAFSSLTKSKWAVCVKMSSGNIKTSSSQSLCAGFPATANSCVCGVSCGDGPRLLSILPKSYRNRSSIGNTQGFKLKIGAF